MLRVRWPGAIKDLLALDIIRLLDSYNEFATSATTVKASPSTTSTSTTTTTSSNIALPPSYYTH